MLAISYNNILKGFNASLNMRCLCPSRKVAQDLYHRACDLWCVQGFTITNLAKNTLHYNNAKIIFENLESIANDSWRGFGGVFMVYHKIDRSTLSPQYRMMLDAMEQHNQRYMDQWQH